MHDDIYWKEKRTVIIQAVLIGELVWLRIWTFGTFKYSLSHQMTN